MKQPTARELMDKLLAHIEARSNSVDEVSLPSWEGRERQRKRAVELAEQLRSMADAIDRTHIDDGK